MSLLPWIRCNSSLFVSDDTLIKFMTDGVLLKEVEKVCIWCRGIAIEMLFQSGEKFGEEKVH